MHTTSDNTGHQFQINNLFRISSTKYSFDLQPSPLLISLSNSDDHRQLRRRSTRPPSVVSMGMRRSRGRKSSQPYGCSWPRRLGPSCRQGSGVRDRSKFVRDEALNVASYPTIAESAEIQDPGTIPAEIHVTTEGLFPLKTSAECTEHPRGIKRKTYYSTAGSVRLALGAEWPVVVEMETKARSSGGWHRSV